MLTHPHELPVYPRWPLRPVRGEGCWLWDEEGRRWLDFYGGHAVALTGHCHPEVVAAVREQAGRLLFYSNAVPLAVRERFLTLLAGLVPESLRRIFLVNSGAEANEQALGLARRATGRPRVTAVAGGFHGRTLATLAVSGLEKYGRLAEASPAGGELRRLTDVCPLGDPEALDRLVGAQTAAVIVEPVQGLAGARETGAEFLRAAREICDRRGAALLFDEVQCGCGRAGAFTAAELYGVTPDALTLAKGIASGLPLGAVLVGERLARGLGAGDLGTTFGGGPLPCAAGAATLEVLRRERLWERAAAAGERLRSGLAGLPGVEAVQGRGLLLGAVLAGPAKAVQERLLERRVIAGGAADPRVLRLLPPLVLEEVHVAEFLAALKEALS